VEKERNSPGFNFLGSTVLVLPQSAGKTRQILPAFGF
jgi:hypothetical protein